MNGANTPLWHTLLVLGRVSNLPTVWSNCLAGWWLAGGGQAGHLPLLLLGTSLMYVGGMYLNDAFDEEFDRSRRAERPIPSGHIAAAQVWQYGFGALGLGMVCLFGTGWTAGLLGLVLAGFILLYDAVHKYVTASPWLMGACRFWVYLIAAAAADGVNGWAIGCGAVLAFYVAGLSQFARRESFAGGLNRVVLHWPFLLLAAPLLLAFLMNTGPALTGALWVGVVFLLWTLFSLRSLREPGGAHVGRMVTGLLAGITMVDWLAVAPDCSRGLSVVFPLLLLATRLAQRFVPAT